MSTKILKDVSGRILLYFCSLRVAKKGKDGEEQLLLFYLGGSRIIEVLAVSTFVDAHLGDAVHRLSHLFLLFRMYGSVLGQGDMEGFLLELLGAFLDNIRVVYRLSAKAEFPGCIEMEPVEDRVLLAAAPPAVQALRGKDEELTWTNAEGLLVFFHEKLSLYDIDEVEGMLEDATRVGIPWTKAGYPADDEMGQWRAFEDYVHF